MYKKNIMFAIPNTQQGFFIRVSIFSSIQVHIWLVAITPFQ